MGTIEEDLDAMCFVDDNGKRLDTSILPWKEMASCWPVDECEVMFIARDGMCSERLGIAIPERRIVLLSHTDIDYDDILFWMEIPPDPRKG